MKTRILITIGVLVCMSSCHSQEPNPVTKKEVNVHEVVVKEVLQASQYTYLLVVENEQDKWVALPKIQAKVGETYFYDNENFEMKDFKSKDLDRTFASVYFLEGVRTEAAKTKTMSPPSGNSPHASAPSGTSPNASAPSGTSPHSTGQSDTYSADVKVVKNDITVEKVKGSITIAELFENKKDYAGKIVTISAKVTKFNAMIMNTNWLHLQDGTDYEGKFDLTATSSATFKVGDNVVLKGKVSLDKDFGYGYFYEVILEQAIAE